MTGALAAMQYNIAPVVQVSVQLHNQNVSATNFTTATASYKIGANGNVYGKSTILEAWLTGTGANSANYEVMASQTSGTTVSGTLGSWLNCGSDNAWSITNSAMDNSVLSAAINVQIRDVATHTVQASASVTLSAESDSRF